ncbi:4-alpha-glucanotransferase [Acetohalobium arabaticum]|uniref:4-alpha-glucanotransferase n=1 Tax=Acetohalobium arabaticum (strain ATCC 49924 / DSM 5501 / Z-7288) TaxID=574087 RepID=D9QVV5_ACEAZ|nr:4-alpha-glucanotransferase [Acetohalobium arabaticum]ADL12364.1 4-alpha-glucanotransferase [Acetohalobium arabaticum DSM 5501]
MEFKRQSGILLHPTSLPGDYGIGSLGEEAYEFIDFLVAADQKLWQILPLGPTGYGDSPYQSFSAFAGNPLLISLERLKEDGLLAADDLKTEKEFALDYVDYDQVTEFKYPLFEKAFQTFKRDAAKSIEDKFQRFCCENSDWLDDYALFKTLKECFEGQPWYEWDEDIKLRRSEAINHYQETLQDRIKFHKFIQYIFFKQWNRLKAYANENYIKIVGDIPIFVAYDSADVWANPELFSLDEDKKPINVAGVPPDYFSETGQLWGNPLYDWQKLKETDYDWWIDRFETTLELVDIVRLDHFRGFAAYWAVPYGEKTAVRGKWKEGPGRDFFRKVKDELKKLPIIAEDLGVITDEVEELRDYFKLPGMNVLQFGFNSQDDNNHLPHNYTKNSVVYTGTHDNNTVLGWYNNADDEAREYAIEYLKASEDNICWDFLQAAWASVSKIAIAPLQDILSLNSEARMNTPGTTKGNWKWRYRKEMLDVNLSKKLKRLTGIYHR